MYILCLVFMAQNVHKGHKLYMGRSGHNHNNFKANSAYDHDRSYDSDYR